LYVVGLVLLILVLFVGVKVKGSQRWIDIPGLFRFQPSELMKIAVPMAVAWYLQQRVLPPSFKHTMFSLLIIGVPAFLIGVEPDLGTSILVAGAGVAVLLLAGLSWRWIFVAFALTAAAAPLLWQFVLKDYQRQRVLTLFDPQSDPLGAGWNIIQSTTAIGSGGVFGKGLYQGSQSYLDFLPEARTDFIVAVVGEELGFVGVAFLLTLYLLIIARGLFLASQAGSTFGRLVAGALVLTFFIYLFVNIAMVSGILPVVGVPLPLVSYGGTSAITLMAGFGIIMSMRTHKAW
jgi:rod shape determining protein RodA